MEENQLNNEYQNFIKLVGQIATDKSKNWTTSERFNFLITYTEKAKLIIKQEDNDLALKQLIKLKKTISTNIIISETLENCLKNVNVYLKEINNLEKENKLDTYFNSFKP